MGKKELLAKLGEIISLVGKEKFEQASVQLDMVEQMAREANLWGDDDIFELFTEIDLFLKDDRATSLEEVKKLYNSIIYKNSELHDRQDRGVG